MHDSTLPLIADYQPDGIFAWRDGEPVCCGQALAEIVALVPHLTQSVPYINLCDDRYYFTLAFAAVALANGINLLPQSRVAGALHTVRSDYPDALPIDEQQIATWLETTPITNARAHCPSLPASRQVAVVFTSGSTGQPTRRSKRWGDLVLGSTLYQERFFPGNERPHAVATVPPQHMYGLETSVLPAFHLGFASDAARPFLPWTVNKVLARLPAPRLLITTPVHLRACLDAGVAMPDIARVISATAPLDAELARAIESDWQTEVHEIYGSTETGSVASRRTTKTDIWTLYDGMRLSSHDGVWLRGPQLPEPFHLSDDLEVLDEHQFRLLGRSGDLLKFAGKRMSVNELTRQLLTLEGVQDAVAFKTDELVPHRPAALVVAPTLTAHEIAAQLAQAVDPVFVPRPLIRIDVLPRNALGKLPRGELMALLREARGQPA